MKISEAYRLAIQAGIECDFRSESEIEKILIKEKKKFDALSGIEKECFDTERLWNPYGDSRISYLPADTEIKKVLWGIDIDTSEVILADRLREKGEEISAVVAHHPLGSADSSFHEVIPIQKELYSHFGVPAKATSKLIDSRKSEVRLGYHSSNYNKAVDAAKILGIPIMNIHTPADNNVERFLTEKMEKEDPKKMRDIVDCLMSIPEYRISAKYNNVPLIAVGKPSDDCGKVVVKMNGGTSSPDGIYEKLKKYGIGTVVGMHFPSSHVKKAEKNGINLLVSCHMASDSLGVNLICDRWEKKGIEVMPCAGFIRVSRN